MRVGSYAYCLDASGVFLVKIFRSYISCYRKKVTLCDPVYIIVKARHKSLIESNDEKRKFKFRRGSVHIAIVTHTREKYKRKNKRYIWFPRNGVVLVNYKYMPLTKRIKRPIPREIADRYPAFASIAPKIV